MRSKYKQAIPEYELLSVSGLPLGPNSPAFPRFAGSALKNCVGFRERLPLSRAGIPALLYHSHPVHDRLRYTKLSDGDRERSFLVHES